MSDYDIIPDDGVRWWAENTSTESKHMARELLARRKHDALHEAACALGDAVLRGAESYGHGRDGRPIPHAEAEAYRAAKAALESEPDWIDRVFAEWAFDEGISEPQARLLKRKLRDAYSEQVTR